jgi:hypothetical protein
MVLLTAVDDEAVLLWPCCSGVMVEAEREREKELVKGPKWVSLSSAYVSAISGRPRRFESITYFS